MTTLNQIYKAEKAFEKWLILFFILIALCSNILLSNISITVLGPNIEPFVSGITVPNNSMPNCISFTQNISFFSGMWSAGSLLNNFSYNSMNLAAVFLFSNNSQYPQPTVWDSTFVGQYGIYFAVISGISITLYLIIKLYKAFIQSRQLLMQNDNKLTPLSRYFESISYFFAMIGIIISFIVILSEPDPIPAPIYQLQLAISSIALITLFFILTGLVIKRIVKKRLEVSNN